VTEAEQRREAHPALVLPGHQQSVRSGAPSGIGEIIPEEPKKKLAF
jgi:hypothetical protein